MTNTCTLTVKTVNKADTFGVVEMPKQIALVSQMLDAPSTKFGQPNRHIALGPSPIIVKRTFYIRCLVWICLPLPKWEGPLVMLKKKKNMQGGGRGFITN